MASLASHILHFFLPWIEQFSAAYFIAMASGFSTACQFLPEQGHGLAFQNWSALLLVLCIVRKCAPAKPVAPVRKKNAITVKFQCSNKRMTESIEVSKASDEPLLEGAQAFAEKASLELSKLVLKFDGDKVDPRMTPDQLGIEDGDCVDVSVRS
ncbi:unnamed protein product [Ixodes pacificus]